MIPSFTITNRIVSTILKNFLDYYYYDIDKDYYNKTNVDVNLYDREEFYNKNTIDLLY